MHSKIDQSLDADLPTVVLFSDIPQSGDGWEKLSNHSCGGFSCNQIDGWGYLLPVCDGLRSAIQAITAEEFCSSCSNTSMDYFGSHADRLEQQKAYRAFLRQSGLSVSDEHLATLMQAAYPLDASAENVRLIVGGDSHPLTDGLKMLILGHNCD